MTVAITRVHSIKVEFQWNGSAWVDETANLISARGSLEHTPPNEAYQGGRQTIQQATITLNNPAHRYSAWHSSSVIYPYRLLGGAYHRRCKISSNLNSLGWNVIFAGYVKFPNENHDKSQVSFTVWDVGEILKQKHSTPVLVDYLEHEVVTHYLDLAGLADGLDYVSPAYSAAHPGTPTTIDYSTRRIPFSWLDDEPVWDELGDLAQAVGARVYVDAVGKVYFRQGWNWGIPGTAAELSANDIAGVEMAYADKSFYDEIVVSYTPRTTGGVMELWKQEDTKLIAPGATEEIICKFRYPAIYVTAPIANTHYYVHSMRLQEASASVSLVITAYAQQATVTVTNTLTETVVLSNLRLLGQPIIALAKEQVKEAISGTTYDKQFTVKDNPYVQTKTQADTIAKFLAWWYGKIKLAITVNGVPGVATRVLGSRYSVPVGTERMIGIAAKIDWQVGVRQGAFSFTQNIEMIEDVFVGTTYFIVGTSALNSGHKVWF